MQARKWVICLFLLLSMGLAPAAQAGFWENLKGGAQAAFEGAVSGVMLPYTFAVHGISHGNWDNYEWNVFEAERQKKYPTQTKASGSSISIYNFSKEQILKNEQDTQELKELNQKIIARQEIIFNQNNQLLNGQDEIKQQLDRIEQTMIDGFARIERKQDLILHEINKLQSDVKHITLLQFTQLAQTAANQGPDSLKAFISHTIHQYAGDKQYQELVIRALKEAIDQSYYALLTDLNHVDNPAFVLQMQKEILDVGNHFLYTLENAHGEFVNTIAFDQIKLEATAAQKLAESLNKYNTKAFLLSDREGRSAKEGGAQIVLDNLLNDKKIRAKKVAKLLENNQFDNLSELSAIEFLAKENELKVAIKNSDLKDDQKMEMNSYLDLLKAELAIKIDMDGQNLNKELKSLEQSIVQNKELNRCEKILTNLIAPMKSEFISKMAQLTLLKMSLAMYESLGQSKEVKDIQELIKEMITAGKDEDIIRKRKEELANLKYIEHVSQSKLLLNVFKYLKEYQLEKGTEASLVLDGIDYSLLQMISSIESNTGMTEELFAPITSIINGIDAGEKKIATKGLAKDTIEKLIAGIQIDLEELQTDVVKTMQDTGCYDKYFTDERIENLCGKKSEGIIETKGFLNLVKHFSADDINIFTEINHDESLKNIEVNYSQIVKKERERAARIEKIKNDFEQNKFSINLRDVKDLPPSLVLQATIDKHKLAENLKFKVDGDDIEYTKGKTFSMNEFIKNKKMVILFPSPQRGGYRRNPNKWKLEIVLNKNDEIEVNVVQTGRR